jgi:hypothetical protein
MFLSIDRVWPGLEPAAEVGGDGANHVPSNTLDFGFQGNNALSALHPKIT